MGDSSSGARKRSLSSGKLLLLTTLRKGERQSLGSPLQLREWTLATPLSMFVSPLEVKPPTGEPDAGDPHVRFGGRGGAIQCAIPTPIELFKFTGFPLEFTPYLIRGRNDKNGEVATFYETIKSEERRVFLLKAHLKTPSCGRGSLLFPQKVETNYHIFPNFVSFFPSTNRVKKIIPNDRQRN